MTEVNLVVISNHFREYDNLISKANHLLSSTQFIPRVAVYRTL